MKQKPIIQKLVLLTLMLLSAVAVSAREFTIDGITYRVISETDKTCAIISADNTAISSNLSLPSVIEISGRVNTFVYDVKEIEYRAFMNCENLVSISIPGSISKVGYEAFLGCCNLKTVTFEPSSSPLVFIKDDMSVSKTFCGCEKLCNLIIGRPLKAASENLWSLHWGYCEYISPGNYDYIEDFTITELTILDGTDISTGDDKKFELFSKNVHTLKVGKNLIGEIGYNAYKGLYNLVMKECQPDADAKFSDRQYLLTKTYVPKGSMSAYRASEGWSRFYSMNEYDSDTFNPATPLPKVYDIASDGLYFKLLDMDDLKFMVTYRGTRDGKPVPSYSGDVEIPSSISINDFDIDVVAVGAEAFAECEGLTSVTIPETVFGIAEDAFRKCSSLNTISIPASVNYLGMRAFRNCKNLESVVFETADKPIGFINENSESGGVYGGQFSGCENLKKIVLGRKTDPQINYHVNGGSPNARNFGLETVADLVIADGVDVKLLKEDFLRNEIRNLTFGRNLKGWTEVNSHTYYNLETVTVMDEEPKPCLMFSDYDYERAHLYVPKGTLAAYKAADGWKNFLNISESGESGIEDTGVTAQKTVVGRYDLSGRQVADGYRGVTIIRYSDGSVEKTLRR